MTNKIALEALKLAGFKNPTAIAEVLSYVPNPSIALEVIMGIHEPIVLDPSTRFYSNRYSDSLYEITRIDELGNKVYYKEYKQKTKSVYYLTKEDCQNKVYQLDRPKGDYYNNGSIPDTGYTEYESKMDVEEYQKSYKAVPIELAFAKLEDWENYGVVIEKDPTDLMLDCH